MRADKDGAPGVRGGVRKWARRLRLGALLGVVALVLIVLFQNMGTATYRILFWEKDVPRLLMLVIVFAAGALAGALVMKAIRRAL